MTASTVAPGGPEKRLNARVFVGMSASVAVLKTETAFRNSALRVKG